jgi:hypothetical protein
MPRRLPIQIPRKTTDIGDRQLPGHVSDDDRGHLRWIRQKGSEEPDSQELEREAETVGIAAALSDQVPSGVIDMEVARELDRADLLGLAAVVALLRLGEKIDRHRVVSRNGRLSRRANRYRIGGKDGPYLSHLDVS